MNYLTMLNNLLRNTEVEVETPDEEQGISYFAIVVRHKYTGTKLYEEIYDNNAQVQAQLKNMYTFHQILQ